MQNKFNNLTYELQDNKTLSNFKNVFKGTPDFKNKIKEIPSQLDLYKFALEMEKQSIDLIKNFYPNQLMIEQRNYLNT